MTDFRIAYKRSKKQYLKDRLLFRSPAKQYDFAFVIHENARGWILEAICKEIAAYYKGNYTFAYDVAHLPPAKAYFYAHYSFFPTALKENPHIWNSKHLVFHTHPKDIGISQEEFNYVFNQATKMICMNSAFAKQLIADGLKESKVTYAIAGADMNMFYHHERGNGAVGFSTAYYDRKDPDRILTVIKTLSHRKFILIGKNWDQYNRYEELRALPNLEYVELTYKEYPAYYAKMDVFVSPAMLEGGPIPLIESMASNVVPVASRTGFAQDLITDGVNGFTFDINSSAEEICQLIEKAFELKTNIRETVTKYTWERFSKQIQEYL
jgi:glycosyltransferase involved in cell wall biosynthesis